MAATKDFIIEQGRTFQHVLRWEAPPYVYKPITSISQAAPAVVTATGHGVPNGWRVTIVSVRGMTQINAVNDPPKTSDYTQATVLTSDTLELNKINSADFKPHTANTGYVQYLTPVDMTGYTARMNIKDKVGGTILASTEVGDTPLDTITITIDNTAKTISLLIDAADTVAITWVKGVYDLEMVNGGVVTALLTGKVTVTKEVTTG